MALRPPLQAALLMVGASALFATMSVAVKWASALYSAGEIVAYRGAVGCLMLGLLARVPGRTLRTTLPVAHFWRALTGAVSLALWFYAIGSLPLATAVTLNYTSSVWLAMFMMGGALWLGAARVDPRLVAAVLVGFAGVALVLRPSMAPHQVWHALAGLASGLLAATAYLQVQALGRAGEPDYRIVFYFSLASVAAGALLGLLDGWHGHSLRGVGLLLATGVLATSGQMMMTRAYAVGGTLANASLQYLGIVFSFGYGVWLFDDPVTGTALLGMLLIVAAGLAANHLALRTKADGNTTGV